MKKVIIFKFFISLFSVSLQAQDSVRLTLTHAIEEALKNNRDLKLSGIDEKIASAKYDQTHAVFLPQINLSYTAFTTNNPLNAFGFKLQQQSISANDFNPSLLNNPRTTQNYMAKAEWNQPILNMDMIAQRKAVHEQISIYVYKTKRTKEYLVFEVQKAYSQLQVAHQAASAMAGALQTIKSIYKSTQDYFEKGLLLKSDLLQVQVQLASIESKLAEAKSNIRNASDYLSLLMGGQAGVTYSTPVLEKNLNPVSEGIQVPANRADFQATQSALAAQSLMVASGRFSYLPKFNAFANYFFNDNTALGFKSNSYLAGAQVSWSLFNGFSTKSKISEYKNELHKIEQQLLYQKEQAQLELNKTSRQLADANFNVYQMESAVEIGRASCRERVCLYV